jgi:hypothetical protein
MPVRRLLAPALVALVALVVLSIGVAVEVAGGQEAPPPPVTVAPAPTTGPVGADAPIDTNPCHDPILTLKCPDLRMKPPADLRVRKAGRVLQLLATNHIVNVGAGPLELRADHSGNAVKSGYRFAHAYQVVHRWTGPALFFPEAGWVYWKAIPGQGHYWKYWRAARFELWTLNADGTRRQLRRTGPKLSYCFRDLKRVRTWTRTPKRRIFPGCSQRFGRSQLRLGVSPGWADIYPSTYHENWISITGLKGCFAFVHRADPLDDIIEEQEDNNIGERVIRLPPRHGSVAPRGCAGKTSP